MNEDLDFDNYPTLHLHLMIDDYYELCEEGGEIETEQTEYIDSETGYRSSIDPNGRFSFCFTG